MTENTRPVPPPPQWVIDLNSRPPRPSKAANIPDPPGYSPLKAGGKQVQSDYLTEILRQGKINDRNDRSNGCFLQQRVSQQHGQAASTPPGKSAETDALKLKKAWEVALAPSKQLPMNAIMMYMSGNSLQIFSIMMVFMLFKGPIQGLLNTNSAFAKFETERTKGKMISVKVVYVLMQLMLLGLGVWKVNAMGLLPYDLLFPLPLLPFQLRCKKLTSSVVLRSRTTRSDWLAWETEREPLERAYFAFR